MHSDIHLEPYSCPLCSRAWEVFRDSSRTYWTTYEALIPKWLDTRTCPDCNSAFPGRKKIKYITEDMMEGMGGYEDVTPQQVMDLQNKGMSYPQIADALNIGTATVGRKIKQYKESMQ